MVRTAAVLILLASASVAAPVPKALKAKRPTLEGVWEAVSMTSNGRDILPGNTTVWVIRGDTLFRTTRQQDGSVPPTPDGASLIELKANPDRPGEIDYTSNPATQTGLFRALFEVTADEFTILFADQNADRPAELKEGAGVYFYKFKRVEK